MKFHVLFCLAILGLLFSARSARADSVPGHFTINLNDNCSVNPYNQDCNNVNGSGGWGADNSFTDTVNTVNNDRGFTLNSFTCTDYQGWDPWWWQNNNESDCDTDPSIKISPGGNSSPFGTSFSADANGGGILDFYNSGGTITDILIKTNLQAGVTYTCNGGGLFQFCGFEAVNGQLEILFLAGNDPGIVTATPEPAAAIPVLLAFAAIAFARRRRSAV
jgi:MYXO-CTERM domain-containing protein